MARLDDDADVIQIGDVSIFPMTESETGSVSLTYGTLKTYYVGVDESLELKPVYPGYHTFSITPDLPLGLTFNNRSGIITGSVTKDVVNSTVYSVNATYSLTGVPETTTFTLTIQGMIEGGR